MLETGNSQRLTLAHRLILLVVVLGVVAGLLGLASARAWLTASPQQADAPHDFAAGVALPDVQLLSGSGEPASLTELRGRPLLLFFGYTSCPDYCPLTLGTFVDVKQLLGPQARLVQFVFVSIDGERDTPDEVARYVDRFDSTFIGLTGYPDDVRRLGEPLGLWFEAQSSNGANGFAMDHTADIYLIGPDGAPLRSYPFDPAPEKLAGDLRALLETE